MSAPFAAHVADTQPEPFNWADHDRRQAERSAALAKALEAWRETARTFMQFDRLGEGQ